MADDFYAIKRIYEGYNVGTQSSFQHADVTSDHDNSYETTSSMMGPGHGQVVGSNTGLGTANDILEAPIKRYTAEQLKDELIEKISSELDEAAKKKMGYAENSLKRLLNFLLDLDKTKD
jgi:hypothetical protein